MSAALFDRPSVSRLALHFSTAVHKGWNARQIADQFNCEGRTSPHGKAFTATAIRAAVSRCGLTKVRRAADKVRLVLTKDEWLVPELARELAVRPHLVYGLICSGRLPARQLDGPNGRWIVHADADMLESLRTAGIAPKRPTKPNGAKPRCPGSTSDNV